MKITRKDIANYKLLKVLLERDKRKLEKYIDKRPSEFMGKVYGSNPEFPYQERGFSVCGCLSSEIQRVKEWEETCRELEVIIQEDIKKLNEIEAAIDKTIASCRDLEDKAILEYTKDGLSQQQIAMRVGLEQSVVSRRLKKYVSD